MRVKLRIGDNEFATKKQALSFYKEILNQYNFGAPLSDEDFWNILDLINYAWFSDIKVENYDSEIVLGSSDEHTDFIVDDIKVAKVQFAAKCFEVFYSNGESQYISYIMLVNRKTYTQEQLFNVACRNSIHDDINRVKQSYFKETAVGSLAKCQETNMASKWEDLVVDHRQPNTFSVILDRFKELHKIDLDGIEYTSANNNMIVFKDLDLMQKFRSYHREKANLRIVRKECNASRASMAHAKRKSKDLIIKQSDQLSLF
ncbi:DUF3223 domain-containing protein [Hymenobacter psoromatis]|uniref:DUF3223 domain-containing protein n=1 Tax=Hymenobacter psoromatis TaxID=1484116 RepID=UPI001CBC58A2|nr:DUF3223 domain-containing protein [Hymenobacter psoromatis]